MINNKDSGFLCPVCRESLKINEKSLICRNNHNFDFAKSGYVNLLLSSAMNTKTPGDNKLMVKARREFLDKGYYDELAKKLCEAAEKYSKNDSKILDAGCGEGYYTEKVFASFFEKNKKVDIYGIDISKIALDYAAKRINNVRFAVASSFHLPFADKSIDILMTLFSPYCGEEFKRILPQKGKMIMVIPGEKHLWELKKAVYDKPYLNEVNEYNLAGFELLEKIPVSYNIYLPCQEDIANLFAMTPYFYKTGEDGKKRLYELGNLETEVSFEILIYEREGNK